MYENRELLSQLETARKEQESSASAANPQLKRWVKESLYVLHDVFVVNSPHNSGQGCVWLYVMLGQ